MTTKTKRRDIGSIYLSKGKVCEREAPLFKELISKFYIQITEDCSFKKGDYINLENKASRIESLTQLKADGKLDEEFADKLIARAEATPEFVKATLVQIKKEA